jgi:hypothetical protein
MSNHDLLTTFKLCWEADWDFNKPRRNQVYGRYLVADTLGSMAATLGGQVEAPVT